jgi:lipid A 4'-phosphatase
MRGLAIYAAVVVATIAVFSLTPGIDLFFSSLFYDPQHGFALAAWRPLQLLEGFIPWLTGGLVVLVLAGGTWLRLFHRPLCGLDRKALLFIVVATALGPGLIVNAGLKDNWGRARPYQIEQFGGNKIFTPPLIPADQCARNCSFVSGHTALAFSLVGLVFLLPAGRRRRAAFGAALGFGALIGLGRIAAGHHFLSDVVDAALISIAVSWLMHRWIVVHDGLTPIIRWIGQRAETPFGRRVLWAGSILLIEAAAILWIDRPLAESLHKHPVAAQPFFHAVERFGLGYPYLVPSVIAFAVLRWGGRLEPLRRWDSSMRAVAHIPLFLFTAVAVSGMVADIFKIIVGRARPKLLFADGTYGFTWFGWRADHWSFPSGHAATAAAVMTVLWCLWPRPLWLYVVGAALVAMSRVMTSQHYFSDVIAGAAIGVIVARVLATWLLRQRDATPLRPEGDAAPGYRAV